MEYPFEREAMRNEAMPTHLSGAEQLLYQGLRMIYLQYHNGTISRERAKQEKHQLEREYNRNSLIEKQWAQTAKLWARLEAPIAAFRERPTVENAQRCMELLYGVPIQWKNPQKTDEIGG